MIADFVFSKKSLHLIYRKRIVIFCIRLSAKDCQILKTFGDVAQLGERMNGIHEVRGSNPLVSTNKINNLRQASGVPFLFRCQMNFAIAFISGNRQFSQIYTNQ